jgi:hypothetical protein
MKPRLLGEETTSHKLVAACRRLRPGFPMVHIAAHNEDWCGLNDDDSFDAWPIGAFELVKKTARCVRQRRDQ